MRNLLIMFIFAATLAHARSDYEETRELTLDAADLQALRIEAGAGSLEIIGEADTDGIAVNALITVPDASPDEAAERMDERMVLSLVRKDGGAELKGYFRSGGNWFGDSPGIRLEVRMPARMSLDVKDGSGSIEVRDVRGDIELDDGSGSITMAEVAGNLRLKDGSGSIEISDAGGDISLVDGSGSISLRGVAGSVTIEDGSGSIDVAGVSGDVTIPESGSGSVDVRDVQGRVARDD